MKAQWSPDRTIRWTTVQDLPRATIVEAMVSELRLRSIKIADVDPRGGWIRIYSRKTRVLATGGRGGSGVALGKISAFLLRVYDDGQVTLEAEDGPWVRQGPNSRCRDHDRCMHPNIETEMEEIALVLRAVRLAPVYQPAPTSPSI